MFNILLPRSECSEGSSSLQSRRLVDNGSTHPTVSQPPFWFVRTEGIGTSEKGEGRKNHPHPLTQFTPAPRPGSLCCTHSRSSRFPNPSYGCREFSPCSLICWHCRLTKQQFFTGNISIRLTAYIAIRP